MFSGCVVLLGDCCGPVVAIVRLASGRSAPFCQPHIDGYLDQADNHPHLEPLNLWWINREAA